MQKIAEIVQPEGVEAVILGLPLNMDGSEGPPAKLAAAELTRKKAKERLGAVAAAQILEAFLESEGR